MFLERERGKKIKIKKGEKREGWRRRRLIHNFKESTLIKARARTTEETFLNIS